MKKLFAHILIPGIIATTAHAAVFISDFDSAPYAPGIGLDGVDGWTLTGSSATNVAFIGNSPFPPPSSGGSAIHLGLNPLDAGESSAYLYQSPSSGLVNNPGGFTSFGAEFTLTDSSDSFPNRDSFAFTFRGENDANLFTVGLTPQSQSVQPSQNTRLDTLSWSSDYAGGGANIGTTQQGVGYNMNILFTPSGTNDVDFSIKFSGIQFASGTLAGAANEIVETWGFEWILFDQNDPDNAGTNRLVVDDVSFIPEPSAAMLMMLTGLAFLVRRSR